MTDWGPWSFARSITIHTDGPEDQSVITALRVSGDGDVDASSMDLLDACDRESEFGSIEWGNLQATL